MSSRAARFGAATAFAAGLMSFAALASAAPVAHAAPAESGRGLSLVLSLAVVSLVPFLFLSLTAFVKISTVLQITKSAIGSQSVPSSTVVLALSGALTLLAMGPTAETILARAAPVLAEKGDSPDVVVKVVEASKEPLRAFLKANTSDKELARFVEVARASRPEATRAEVKPDDFPVLAPAFVGTVNTGHFRF